MDESLIFLNTKLPPATFARLILVLEDGTLFSASESTIKSLKELFPCINAEIDWTDNLKLPPNFVVESWLLKVAIYYAGYELLASGFSSTPSAAAAVAADSWFHEFSFLDILFYSNKIDWNFFFEQIILSIRSNKFLIFSGDLAVFIKDSVKEAFPKVRILCAEFELGEGFCFSSKKIPCKKILAVNENVWHFKYNHYKNDLTGELLVETSCYFCL